MRRVSRSFSSEKKFGDVRARHDRNTEPTVVAQLLHSSNAVTRLMR